MGGRAPIKLGVFMPNCRYSMSISTYKPNPEEWEFEHNVRIAQLAEAENFDFLFPSARWRGVGGKTDYQGTNIETLTWAASMLQRTKRIGVYSTVHVPIYHPFLVAKVGAGLDYMSGGRWGLNVVSGWNQPEFEMMGLEMGGHEKRYERTTDFIKVIKGLWTAEPGTFDFDSEWYQIRQGWISPMPKSQPHPPIINAGTSDAGRNLVAQPLRLVLHDSAVPRSRRRDDRRYQGTCCERRSRSSLRRGPVLDPGQNPRRSRGYEAKDPGRCRHGGARELDGWGPDGQRILRYPHLGHVLSQWRVPARRRDEGDHCRGHRAISTAPASMACC